MIPESAPNALESSAPSSAELATVTAMVSRFIQARKVSHQDYQALSEQVLEDGAIDEEERQQINRLFDAIQDGVVKIVP